MTKNDCDDSPKAKFPRRLAFGVPLALILAGCFATGTAAWSGTIDRTDGSKLTVKFSETFTGLFNGMSVGDTKSGTDVRSVSMRSGAGVIAVTETVVTVDGVEIATIPSGTKVVAISVAKRNVTVTADGKMIPGPTDRE